MAAAAQIHNANASAPQPANRPARHYAGTSFRQVLSNAFDTQVTAGSARPLVHHAAMRVRLPPHSAAARTMPDTATTALSAAMAKENVPAAWHSSLSFIMAQESAGKVGVHSPWHSARGLYQLTAANYHYNPRGAASFGNAVEEAQGGIRYIRARYGTADKAAAFWRAHHWY